MSTLRRFVVAALLLAAASPPLAAQERTSASSGDVPLYETLGDQTRRVTTDDLLAQAYFDQGLRLMYAFDTGRALRSFRAAQRHDPECAMCLWGEAWALGPYLNGGMDAEAEAQAHRAATRAAELAGSGATAAERALIEASLARYAARPDPERRTRLDSAYARSMARAAVEHPRDDDVWTLWAESMMLLRPRYEIRDLSDPGVRRIRHALEEVLDRNLEHPGACHLYIHLMEMTDEPEAAEACAEVLDDRIPGASHIQHMPSHVYMRIGRYGDAVLSNRDAWRVDQRGEKRGGIPIYPEHNLEMLAFAANYDGQGAVAVDAARRLAAVRPSSAILLPQSLALFGRWDEILERTELPDNAFAEGGWRFARGLALLRKGDVDGARRERERLRRLQRAVPSTDSYRGAPHPELLDLAERIVRGELALAEGRTDEAVETLASAVAVEDGFRYSEPEAWHLPARRFLGEALLEAGRPAEAERVFREALDDHPDEGWSLRGLERAVGEQGRRREALRIHARFREAWARSDVWLPASRF